ncbi:hypothetical protein N9W79_01595, partial [bacterium]|nr:hypothetical protein [bacterium]
MNKKNQVLNDLIIMQVVVLIWGLTGVIGKFSDQPAEELAAGRMILASICLLPFYFKNSFKTKTAK